MSTSVRGYILLIPVLLVSTGLMLITLSASRSVFIVQRIAEEYAQSVQSNARAHTCIQAALFELVADPLYRPQHAGDTVTATPELSCVIESVVHRGSYITIRVRGTYVTSVTRLEAQVLYNDIISPLDIHIRSLKTI